MMVGGAVAREPGVEREQQIRKMGRKREREQSCKIDKLIWLFYKSDGVK